jgi:hypothetical protein
MNKSKNYKIFFINWLQFGSVFEKKYPSNSKKTIKKHTNLYRQTIHRSKQIFRLRIKQLT